MIREMSVVSFDGVVLKGTLTIPANPSKIIITLHGSFIQNRDGDLDGAQKWMFPEGTPKRKLFRDIADSLSLEGIGSYRYDKRASGESGGDYRETDLIDLAKDASAALKAVKNKFPGVPVGFVAQSEGTMVVLKEFEIGTRPDFIILQAPSLEPLDKLMAFQKDHAAAPFLADHDQSLSRRFPYLSAFYQAVFHRDLLEKALHSEDDYYDLKLGDWSYRTNLRKYRQYGWDGYEMLKTVTCPVQIIVGDQDKNVPQEAIKRIVEEKPKGNFENVKVKVLPGLEHSFRQVAPGESFIDTMAKPISSEFLDTLKQSLLEI